LCHGAVLGEEVQVVNDRSFDIFSYDLAAAERVGRLSAERTTQLEESSISPLLQGRAMRIRYQSFLI
jgi:hypothetical protein